MRYQAELNPRKSLWVVIIFFLTSCFDLIGQSSEVHEVYLTGNLTDIERFDPFFESLKREFVAQKNQFSLILNGDLLDDSSKGSVSNQGSFKLFRLIDLCANFENGRLLIVPGDRDWDDNGKDGYEQVRDLEKKVKTYIKKQKINNVKWFMKKSCPGPFQMELDEHLLLVGLNSQWWNHPYYKPQASDALCKYATPQDIKEEFEDILDENRNKNILVVAHHPVKSLGNYGGRFSLVDNLKPFPILGSFKTAYHAQIGDVHDLSNEKMEPFQELINGSLFAHSNLIFASSHEKNQQVMEINDNYLINSGSIGKTSYAGSDNTTVFRDNSKGMMRISYGKDGVVWCKYLKLDDNNSSFEEVFEKKLFTSACNLNSEEENLKENLIYIPCKLGAQQLLDEKDQLDSVSQVAAAPQYWKKGFYRFWMGDHYRKDWATPIDVKFLNIDTTFNGLSVLKRGGGRQTLSLKFQAENGARYTFRSVDKDPSKALNYKLRTSIISRIFKDQTSTQQPYGALIVSSLLDDIDILHATPRLYRLPNVNALGAFQKRYGGMLGMLEENPGHKDNEGHNFATADKILKSNKLFRKLYENQNHQLKEEEFIRARLFDILIGDWSKHEDNWKWAAFKTGDTTLYRPIPRDRDHAFSKWDGVLPSLADLPFGAPNTEGFDYHIRGFKSLVRQARYMDRFLTTRAEKEVYLQQARFIQKHIDQKDIEDAVRQLPSSIYDISGQEIIKKLNSRKNDLIDYAEQYYNWLNLEVDIVGTTNDEYIEILGREDGVLTISMFNRINAPKGQTPFYSRNFYPDQTKEVRIYALGGDDIFQIKGSNKLKIKLRLLGGTGINNYLSEETHKEILVYDLGGDENTLNNYFTKVDHWNTEIYEYDRQQLRFDSWTPSLLLGYNVYNGITLGAGNTWTNQRWGKKDFASKHHVNIRGSSKGNWGLKYAGQWHHVFNKIDLTGAISLANPEYFNTFYGTGNSTIIDTQLEGKDYYLVNFNRYNALLGVKMDFWKKSHISLQSGYEINSNKRVDGTILDIAGAGVLGANTSLSMLPLLFEVEIDFRDDPKLPYEGISATLRSSNYWIIDQNYNYYGMISGMLDYFVSTNNKKKLTLGLKIEGSKGLGEIPFYYQSLLGGNNGLRGYTNNRFSGRSKLLLNTELRWEILNNKKSSIPIRFGLLGFYDMGKVINENDLEGDAAGFHTGYGFGIFVVPFTRSVSFSLTMSFSNENTFFPGFTFGTALK